MRRAFSILLILSMLLLAGCSAKEDGQEELLLYATFYPLYAAADMIAADVPDMRVECLVQPQDGCLRDYALSDWDYALLESADAVIAGGRGLESFEETLYSMGADGPAVSAVLYNMPLSKADIDVSDDEDSHWADENPHLYMKTEGMLSICESIAAHLSVIDPQYRELYMHNLEKTENRLKSLQESMLETAKDCAGAKVIVMNEAALYVAEEFGMDIALCINRDSGEAFYGESLENCIEKMRQSGAELVLIEKQAPKVFTDAIENAGFTLAKIDVLSTHRANEGSEAYFEAQMKNAKTIADAVAGGK